MIGWNVQLNGIEYKFLSEMKQLNLFLSGPGTRIWFHPSPYLEREDAASPVNR